MLNPKKLQEQIQQAFEEVLPNALEQGILAIFPEKSNTGDEYAKTFAESVTELVAKDLSTRLAGAIDYYVKNANVYGTIITMGGPFTQMASVNTPQVMMGGKVPNMLGIM